jgi:uncharacterized membrane protein YqjE
MIASIGTATSGMFGSLRRLLDTGIAILQNRIELAALELNEEKARLVSILVWAAAAIFLGIMTTIAIMFTVVMALWEHALWVLAGFSGLFLIGALVSVLALKSKFKGPAPFAETVEQLKKDRQWLQTRT